jgi:hypothetical protein
MAVDGMMMSEPFIPLKKSPLPYRENGLKSSFLKKSLIILTFPKSSFSPILLGDELLFSLFMQHFESS